ncbi:MAG: DUF3604 domain-containing protein [Gammaproteobacteria bacterium]|nr:DUF3604 domain-containing protein [Gammaproteobacteria bacterium]
MRLSDAHTGFSDNEEFNYTGAHGAVDSTAKKRQPGIHTVRAAIFDTLQRKETFGTSGPLIRVRFFGGWDYPKDLVKDKEFVKKAYAGGVPMGGDLPARKGKNLAKAPSFAV